MHQKRHFQHPIGILKFMRTMSCVSYCTRIGRRALPFSHSSTAPLVAAFFHSQHPKHPTKSTQTQTQTHLRSSSSDVEDDLKVFDAMLHSRPRPHVIRFNQFLTRLTKLKHYSTVITLSRRLRLSGVAPDDYTLCIMINCYSHLNELGFSLSVLGHFFKLGLQPNTITFTTLIHGIVLHNQPAVASRFFFKMVKETHCKPDVRTFSTLIKGFCNMGDIDMAMQLLSQMEQQYACKPNSVTYNTIIDRLCKDTLVADAMMLFSEMTGRGITPNVITYTSLIQGNCNIGRMEEAERLIEKMIQRRIEPDTITYNSLMDGYCLVGEMDKARQVFDHMISKGYLVDVFSWTKLINGYCKQKKMKEANKVFQEMTCGELLPNTITYTTLVDGFCKEGKLNEARKLFDAMPERNLYSWNAMIDGYAKRGKLHEARKLFEEMPERNEFSWTPMVLGYVQHERPNEALELYRMMPREESSKSDKLILSSVLAASATVGSLRTGKEIHGYIMRTGLDSDEVVVWNALLDMYGKCGSIEAARRVFDKMGNQNVVTWNAMIERYLEGGNKDEGFGLFLELMKSGIMPDEVTFAGVLNACADHATENLGKEIHGYMTRVGFDKDTLAANALVDMYSKCGNTIKANVVFKGMPSPDLVSWNSLISGYAQNSQAEEALQSFESLLKSGTLPDHITFLGVLSACAHSGFVDRGLEYFHSIKAQHGFEHTVELYACVVGLLARAGRFEEAESIINEMPMKPSTSLWASLLGGCRIHGNVKLAKRAAEALCEIEPENPGNYTQLANIYAAAGMWSEVTGVRKKMDERGMRSRSGLSWIEIKR